MSHQSYVIENLSREGIPHRSMIIGDGPAKTTLEKRLPGTIFAGYRRGEDLSAAYASSDIFLFPSDTETFGNVTLVDEAQNLDEPLHKISRIAGIDGRGRFFRHEHGGEFLDGRIDLAR